MPTLVRTPLTYAENFFCLFFFSVLRDNTNAIRRYRLYFQIRFFFFLFVKTVYDDYVFSFSGKALRYFSKISTSFRTPVRKSGWVANRFDGSSSDGHAFPGGDDFSAVLDSPVLDASERFWIQNTADTGEELGVGTDLISFRFRENYARRF